MAIFKCSDNEAGFTLAETLVATAILATSLVGLAQLLAISVSTNSSARANTFATVLAEQKLEQLRALTWGFDSLGLPLSDLTTDTTVVPQAANGGTGLTPSPGGTLISNVAGYVDYLDVYGKSLGGGGNPPANTIYTRRWSVEPLPTNPNDTIIIQVLVSKKTNRGSADSGNAGRMPNEARIMCIKTRKAQ